MDTKLVKKGRGRYKHGAFTSHLSKVERRWMNETFLSIANDLGGVDSLSAQQQILIQNCCRALRVLWCIDRWLKPSTIIDSTGTLAPCLRDNYLAYLNALRHNLIALGIKRVEGKELSLQDYIKANYPEPNTPAKSTTASQEGQGGTISSGQGESGGK